MTFKAPKGTRDFLPETMEKRRFVFDKIREVFDSYGFGEVDTPAFESLELLTKKGSLGDEAVKDIYRFEDKAERKLGLRFDPTTPIARIVANKKGLKKPIKWCYNFVKMWRYEDVKKGRYREFSQSGVELIGSDSKAADAEVMMIVIDILKGLGLKDFYLRVNSRKILEKISKKLNFKNKKIQVFREVDKIEKQGEKKVKKELNDLIGKEKTQKLLEVLRMDADQIKNFLDKKNMRILKTISLLPKKYKKYVNLDFSIARGLDYYTGFIFETFIKNFENLGSVASGGRYDNLIERYGGKATPATGWGMGVDRLVPTSEEKKLIQLKQKTKVYVAPVTKNQLKKSIEIGNKLRKKYICEVGLDSKSLSKQLSYAGDFDYTIIVGEKDLKKGKVTVKNMKTGKENKIDIDSVKKSIK